MAYAYERHALERIEEALGYARVVLLLGPRQAGKSTLATEVVRRGHLSEILTLDDRSTRSLAQDDPDGMIGSLGRPVAIDEIQRVPDLLLAIKQTVDRNDDPGQFLLTGSANVLTAPRVLDALTGRTEIVHLWPLAQDEIHPERDAGNLIDLLFKGEPPDVRDALVGPDVWLEDALAGGFPEARTRQSVRARRAWFNTYVTSLVERDLRDLSDARLLEEVPELLEILAGQVGGTLVTNRIAKRLGLAHKTVESYIHLLATAFTVMRIPAWLPGVAHRERQAPKVIFTDTGVLAHQLDFDLSSLNAHPTTTGPLFENFVVMELIKQLEWSESDARISHYRREGAEVDLLIQKRSGAFLAIEAKASATLGAKDWRMLKQLREARDEHFRAGIIFYTGTHTRPLGDRLWALPISALWRR